MRKIKDEQKGIIFIILILFIVGLALAIFSTSLKTDVVEDTLKSDKI